MRKTISDMVIEFRLHWKNYILQSVLASLTLLIALWMLRARSLVIVASIGSTAFIVFAMPGYFTARPRNVIGGQVVGLLCGALGSLFAGPSSDYVIIASAAAVGLSIFVMVLTDTEHPPASGTALGIAMSGCSWDVALAVVGSAVLLSVAHRLLRPYLRDLA